MNNTQLATLLLLFVLTPITVQTTADNHGNPIVTDRTPFDLERVDSDVDVRIDGEVSEDVWNRASKVTDLRLTNQGIDEMNPLEFRTEVHVFYNDQGIYAAFRLEQDLETLVMFHSAPDQGSFNRDFATIAIDTSGEGKYGFFFTLYCGGSKRDGVIAPENDWQRSWNGAWHGRTSLQDDGWSAEFFIPWSILSMPSGDKERTIGLHVSRRFASRSEQYAWPHIHSSSQRFLSDFHPVVIKDVTPKQQLSVIPFIATNVDMLSKRQEDQIGADIFWRPLSNFQLTATVFPDFGTVEADDVIINLSQFETFLDEKRLFFIEGQEVFLPQRDGWGEDIVPFHSRRIGGPPSIPTPSEGVTLDYSRLERGVDLLAAVKGVGQLGNWRYGALGAWEDDTSFGASFQGNSTSIEVPGRDFGVMRLLYEDQVEDASFRLGMLSTARWDQTEGDAFSYTFDGRLIDSARNFGIEGHLYVSDVTGQRNGYGGYAGFGHNLGPNTHWNTTLEFVDKYLDMNPMGYNFRNDEVQLSGQLNHGWYSTEHFQQIGLNAGVRSSWNTNGDRISSRISIGSNMQFKNQNFAGLWLNFQPSHLNDSIAYGVVKFRTKNRYGLWTDFETDNTKKIRYRVNVGISTEITGEKFMAADLRLSYQPFESLRSSIEWSKGDSNGWLNYRGDGRFTNFRSWNTGLRLSTEYFPTPYQQFRLDFQWENFQSKGFEYFVVPAGTTKLVSVGLATPDDSDDLHFAGVSFQLRYRWEISPLSDVFVVYTKTANRSGLIDNSNTATLRELLRESDSENFAAKIRYRFGA